MSLILEVRDMELGLSDPSPWKIILEFSEAKGAPKVFLLLKSDSAILSSIYGPVGATGGHW